jgi:hypothetical protein
MSHSKQRAEKICLNCNTVLTDRYCQHCGQENVEPKQSLWHLIVHFFNDITHFDGKLFTTLKYLVFRPGFLSSEYIKGKRMAYLDPIRMYLFISSIFFIVMLSVLPEPKFQSYKDQELVHATDSLRKTHYTDGFGNYGKLVHGKQVFVVNVKEECRHGYHHYDSLIKAGTIKPNFLHRHFDKKWIGVYEVYDKDPINFMPKFLGKFFHSVSKGFFISLPVFAFLLFLLYIRRRNNYYFVTHAIFAIHFYTVGFVIGLVVLLLGMIGGVFANDSIQLLAVFIIWVYLYIAMLRFYKQHWFKTFIKFFILSFLFNVALAFIVIGLLFDSMLSMATAH